MEHAVHVVAGTTDLAHVSDLVAPALDEPTAVPCAMGRLHRGCCELLRIQQGLPNDRFQRFRPAPWLAILLLLVWSSPLGKAQAQVIGAEVAAVAPLADPQASEFGWGIGIAGTLLYPLSDVLAAGGRLGALWLADRDAVPGQYRAQPEVGAHLGLSALLRAHPFGGASQGNGAFIGLGVGVGITGSLFRPHVEGALGYGWPLSDLSLAPMIRYLQVIQGDHPLEARDARILLLGVAITYGQPPAPPQTLQASLEPAPVDTDGDGVPDLHDQCPHEAEDADGFEDEDGCPDGDDDGDGIADGDDACPELPEDVDSFQDEDGCPDEDNDQDGFVDGSDACPDEPETVNGNRDDDGCPDRGLIEFKDDRIVLEERVLFDVDRARVKSAARPVLRAIVHLHRQHPEWVRVRIEGHADTRGDRAYNQHLSERRAQRVLEALVSLGMKREQVDAQGFGASRPRDDRHTDEGHRRNRRVEFVVTARQPIPAVEEGPARPSAISGLEAAGPNAVREGGR